MKIKLLQYLCICLAALCVWGCRSAPTVANTAPEMSDMQDNACLAATQDMGQAYVDSFIFFGESTTYHMISRGVLRNGKQTTQVWAPRNGTVNLDTTVTTLRILYPQTGEELTIAEAAARARPAYMLLTFGLNGAVQNVARGEDYYKQVYSSLIDSIQKASPHTVVILQSAYPIAKSMDMSRYSVDAATLNKHISTLNGWALSLCSARGIPFLNSAEVLCDSEGYLQERFHVGDGHHLTAEAYEVMLRYLRTHGYKGEKT